MEKTGISQPNLQSWFRVMLAAFLVVSFFDLYVIAQMPAPAKEATICQLAGDEENGAIPKLSEVVAKKVPSLGGAGAAVEKVASPACSPLSAGQWILLLATYVFLLIFNLFYPHTHSTPSRINGADELKKKKTTHSDVPDKKQWVWGCIESEKTPGLRWRFETFLAVFTLVVWFAFDTCRDFLWFPLEILKSSLLVYFFYYYFKTRPAVPEKELENKKESV